MTTPRTPRRDVDYKLTIVPAYDQQKKRYHLFVLETAQEFSSFQYELVVDEELAGNAITLKIHGLRPKSLAMPGFGSAQFRKECYGLKGTYALNIIRQDDTKNQFRIHVSGKKVKIIRGVVKGKFVEVGIAESQSVKSRRS